MNGGLAPLLLLSATIGLMLASMPMRRAALGLCVFLVTALLAWPVAPTIGLSPTLIFGALWLTMIATAALTFIPVGRWSVGLLPMCLVAGFWVGACATLSGDWGALAMGFLPLIIVVPATWLVRRKFGIVVKVVASWMIAIASLSLFVSMLPTPGYQPDHME